MYSLKAYKVEVQGDFPDFKEVEVVAVEVEGFVAHAFGTNTFTIGFEDGSATIYRYQDFSKIELKVLPAPTGIDALIEDDVMGVNDTAH